MHEPRLAEREVLFYCVFLADLETELQTHNQWWLNHYKNDFKIKETTTWESHVQVKSGRYPGGWWA